MDNMKSRTAMRLLLFLYLGRALGIVVRSDVPDDEEIFGRKNYALINKHNGKEGDDKMIRRIEEEMLALNKSGKLPRDKRALGILLQGFMEALGYTMNPIQFASLPNPTPAAQMPAPATAPVPPPAIMARQQAAPMPMPPTMMMPPPAAAAAASAPPQRETLRFTGVLNFGNNANTTNLVSHLAQYETLFHGNGSAQPAAPPPAPAPNIDPRSRPPLPEPLFVKIPLPIAPNLPPPQPPSPMPIHSTYHDEYTKDHAEEFQGGKEDSGRHGDYEEENDNSQHREEYENDHEEYNNDREQYENDEPKDRNYEYKGEEETYEQPKPPQENTTETAYKKNKNVVNYSVENKEIHDPSEVSEEAPIVGSKYGHTMYVGEPNWKQDHEDHLYKLMLEQEANAEALAEDNVEREKERSREHELDEDDVAYSRSREKEISDSNEEREAEYHTKSKEQPYYNDEDDESAEKESYTDNNSNNDEDDYEEESKISEKPTSDSQHKEPPAPPPKPDKPKIETPKNTQKPQNRRYEEYADHDERKPHDYNKNYYDYDEAKEGKHYKTLPISYDREKSRKDDMLRDSYGKSLEKPDGKVDERVADYFTMFKNPHTGVYDPTRIQQYENSRIPYDHTDLVNGFKRIQQEYGRPESKYEEYEIKDDDDDDGAEHRANYKQERNQNESRKNLKKVPPHKSTTPDCDCFTGRSADVQSDEARTSGKRVTTRPPKPLKPPKLSQPPATSVSYGPYYSTVKYLYDPLEYDHGIISRLTSYGPPTTVRFEERADLLRNPSHAIIERQPTIRPTDVPLPEKLTAKSLLHETETKEIRAWPAPFDYVFDNSERSDTIIKGTPYPIETTANNRAPTHKTTFTTTRPACNEEAATLPPSKFAEKVQVLLRNHENERHNVASSNKKRQNARRPHGTHRGRNVKQTGQQSTRVRYV